MTQSVNTNEPRSGGEQPLAEDRASATKADTATGTTTDSTESPTDGLGAQIAGLEAAVKEKEAKYLYLYAEFENFKKRAIKERSDLQKFGWESVALELLQVVDNLERAVTHLPATLDKNLAEGLKMVLQHFRSTLGKQGVQTIESLNKVFDPHLHEAVGQEESNQPQGTIVKEQLAGYTLHGRLLRPARVVISSGVAPAAPSGQS